MAMVKDEDAAAGWAIKKSFGPLSSEDARDLAVWLTKDERRGGALLRAEAALVYMNRAVAVAGPMDEERVDRRQANGWLRRHMGRGLAVASAMAAALVVAVLPASPEEFATTVGEVRNIPLVDGSTATMNTASRISVAVKEDVRQIVLQNGEAWFDVKPDANRPFIVDVGDVRVRAIGTSFSVRRHAEGVDVLVTKGVVETWRVGEEGKRTRMEVGQRSFVPVEASKIVAVKAEGEIERSLEWRKGGLALNGEPLSYAVDEMNRYNRKQLVVTDPVINRTPIVGYFRNDNPDDFARNVAIVVGAKVISEENQLRIVPSAE